VSSGPRATGADDQLRAPARSTAAATLTATIAILPVYLLGSMAVTIRGELGFSEAGLGMAVTAFWAAMTLGGTPGGRLVQRLGATRSIRLGALAAAVTLLGASTSRSYPELVLWMLVGGATSGIANPATDLTIAWNVPAHRRGLAFGVKQSAIPGATLLAGLAIPVFLLTVGWRWAFIAFSVLLVPILLAMPTVPISPPATASAAEGTARPRLTPIVILSGASGMGMVAMTAGAAFYVESTVASGVPLELAGTLLAIGSAVGVAGRLGVAWRFADTRRPFAAVAWITGLGAVGTALIGLGSTGPLLLLATVLALGVGWSWNGLFVHAVVKVHAGAPATAMGVVVSGTAAGGIVGPLLFGVLTERIGYPAGWAMTTVAYALASVLMLVAAPRPGGA
jgi:MFS family permease